MVVLMPSALAAGREDRSRLFFTRFTWESEWPESEVISFSDPAMQQDDRLDGAWYVHPAHDIIKTISEIVAERADAARIPHDRIVFYGSSLGGFGAIGAAAHLPGARAVAEVPQIDFANWIPRVVRALEDYILGMPLESYRELHPEQISLQDRLTLAGRIPELTIVTNPTDRCVDEQRAFFAWMYESDLPKSGPIEILETTRVKGHSVLSRKDISPYIHP